MTTSTTRVSLATLGGPAVTARLRALAATSPRAGTVVASHAYRVSAVQVGGSAVVIPLAGTKRVHIGDRRLDCLPGSVLVLHDRAAMDVENLPDGAGMYFAATIGIPPGVRASVRALVDGPLPSPTDEERVTVCPLSAVESAILVLLGLPETAGALTVDHALAGLAVALVEAGHSRFLSPREPGLAERVRQLAGSDPARPWSAADVERAFHLSGATLRRRLAGEGTSLRRLLVDVRLHHGLALLQSTRKSLKTVAFESGYRSLASFRQQFRARFGCEPGLVRSDVPRRAG